MKIVKMKCENCGAKLEVNKELDKISCNFCGSENLIDDEATELKRVEEVKLEARKQNHEQSLKEREDEFYQEVKLKKEKEELEYKEKFKKGILKKILIALIIIFILSAYSSFNDGKPLAGICAILMVATFLASYLAGMQVIKEKFRYMHVVIALVGLLLFIPFINLYNADVSHKNTSSIECDTIDWDDVYLSSNIIELNNKKGEISSNSKNRLDMTICDFNKEEFNDYKSKIINKGYDIEKEEDINEYIAFNNEGYKIITRWEKENKTLKIYLIAPDEMSEFEWPTNGLATHIPKTKSNYGRISWDNSDTFIVTVGKMSKSDYDDYVKECENYGYTIDHSKSEKYFSAKNSDGYELHLTYEGASVVEVSVKLEKKEESQKEEQKTETKKEKTQKEEQKTTNNGLRSDFKKAMDSYEKFIDEYVKFMKKLDNNSSDLELIKESTEYSQKLQQFTSDFEKWETGDLNDAETKYYIEVQTRVNNKLLSVY